MNILHTEASIGWGGQEIRILAEAIGMHQRGHTLLFAVAQGAKLAGKARDAGFIVYELPLQIRHAPSAIWQLCKIIKEHHIDLINTHSSADAWLGGISGRLMGRKVVRTRHLSTPSKPGLNSRLLYHYLADMTVTTCKSIAETIRKEAQIPAEQCISIPTGIDPVKIRSDASLETALRQQYGLQPSDFVIGTVCMLRSWKGVMDLLLAAKQLEKEPALKWLVIGAGPYQEVLLKKREELGLADKVIFTGHMANPYPAMALMNVFMLLSTANEGVSQASLQAAFLKKPLITTTVGGLPEVCLDTKTGFTVPVNAPEEVAERVRRYLLMPQLLKIHGEAAHKLALQSFTFEQTLNGMEAVYQKLQK